MQLWVCAYGSENVGLVANIGYDFPDELMAKLEKVFDVRGLVELESETVRAWQLFEKDGKRTEIMRTELSDFQPLKPKIRTFPDVYDDLHGIHLHGEGADMAPWIPFLRQRGDPFILWEPWQRDCVPENRGMLVDILPLVDCVSPNLLEAQLMLGKNTPKDLLETYLQLGAKRAAIRAGVDGSYYADTEGNIFRVPAVKVGKIVDQTGAGNAYCGGLAVGFVVSDDPREALCRAAVSASFPLEQFGALFSLENIKQRAESRYRSCMAAMLDLNCDLQ